LGRRRMMNDDRPSAELPPVLEQGVAIESIPPMLSPVPSIRVQGAEDGTHVVSVAPGTRIESIVPTPPLLMLVRLLPYLIPIVFILTWGSIGKIDPKTAIALTTTFVVACLSTRATGGQTVLGSLAKRLRRK
jgi:hypothetical protein